MTLMCVSTMVLKFNKLLLILLRCEIQLLIRTDNFATVGKMTNSVCLFVCLFILFQTSDTYKIILRKLQGQVVRNTQQKVQLCWLLNVCCDKVVIFSHVNK